MKTRFSLVSLLVVLGILLAACGGAATPAPTQAPAPAAEPTKAPAPAEPTKAPEQPAAPATGGTIKGEVTLWHAYGTGSAEEQALTKLIDNAKKANPEATINVLQIPFDQIFNKYQTEVAAGGGPDMFVAPNDDLGNWVRGGFVMDLTDKLAGKLDADSKVAVEGMTVDGKIWGVPESAKAVALYYNKSTVPEPPKTTDELLAMVKAGKKLVLNQNAYHNFGFWQAFGGKLLAADGTCVADQGGFADALQYLLDLKAAGAEFQTDGGKADTLFRQAQADMIINGPWVLGDYKKDLGDKLGVAVMPAGPKGNAGPLNGIDGFHINPNSQNPDGALELALFLTNKDSSQIYTDEAGHVPIRSDVTAKDPLVAGFAKASAQGFPRPQSKEFGNYWGPFGDAITKVLEGKSKPADAVVEACGAMNKASGKSGGAAATEELPAITGEVTLWHAYGTGSAEEQALTELIDNAKKANPDATINVLQIPFDQIFNKYQTEVAAGGGPDMFVAPNDDLGNWVRGSFVSDLTDKLAGKLGAFQQVAIDGMTVDGKIWGVPESAKAVALYYNKSTVPEPPKTTDELLAMVKAGKKLVLNQNAYHNFGFFAAFGGKLMDDTNKCVADQGGFADALQYLLDLKAAGAEFQTDGGKADTLFRQAQADMIINGPWVLGDYKKDLGDKLGVVPMPDGPKGKSAPLNGIDGFHINPNSQNPDGALALALFLTSQASSTIYTEKAGHVPIRKDVNASDPLVAAFAQASAQGFPRPQSKEFGNYWGPFGDAITKVLEGKLKPADAVKEACAAMNKASGK
ncbi:MAG: extracellular solute-binding protein [Anaerolineae bacterium]